MLYRSMFPQDLFSEIASLQRQMEQFFDISPASIRGLGRGGFPAMNVGHTPQSMELYAFVPGLDPGSIEVNVESGALTISGSRADDLSTSEDRATVHMNERFAGQFKRVVSLPEDMDPDGVSARCQDGVLHVSIRRRESAQPRRIDVH